MPCPENPTSWSHSGPPWPSSLPLTSVRTVTLAVSAQFLPTWMPWAAVIQPYPQRHPDGNRHVLCVLLTPSSLSSRRPSAPLLFSWAEPCTLVITLSSLGGRGGGNSVGGLAMCLVLCWLPYTCPSFGAHGSPERWAFLSVCP